ncbi:Adenosylcobinamide-GDP ribazoletransferase [Halomonadaceae bacterium LMG 33818]|uniref:adenosylcobinamide-GDP ribazoletransferase n=1 Tax=Cernens ardua TaxID=3402176 RepID=UPI003EDB96EE
MNSHHWTSELKDQWRLFLLAVSFLTRLKVPAQSPSHDELQSCRRYFPLAGALIGVLLALFFSVCSWIFPLFLSISLTLALGIILTGGFHEDGLADTMDGIGGGFTIEKRLEIMKDSRLGSYGGLAISASLLIRFCALLALTDFVDGVQIGLIAAGAMSRFAAPLMQALLPYARIDDSKMQAFKDKPAARDILIFTLTAVVIAIAASGPGAGILCLIGTLVTVIYLRRWFLQRLGGYTGDTLGATQQLTEIICYLMIYVWFQLYAT